MDKTKSNKQKMIEEYEAVRSMMKEQGYIESEVIISALKANLMAIALATPIVVLCTAIYLLRLSMSPEGISVAGVFGSNGVLLFFAIIICLVLHEVIHGITWSSFCSNKWKSIYLGIMPSSLTPYCHCKEELQSGAYLLGCIMPFIVLGLGMFSVSLIAQSVFLFMLSLFNTLGAGGDMLITLLRQKHRNARIFDHPTKIGFIAFEKMI